jgi:hypothetical protein
MKNACDTTSSSVLYLLRESLRARLLLSVLVLLADKLHCNLLLWVSRGSNLLTMMSLKKATWQVKGIRRMILAGSKLKRQRIYAGKSTAALKFMWCPSVFAGVYALLIENPGK